jgi:hypothetical protein
VPGGEDDNLSFLDTVPSEVDNEEEVVERLAAEQIREELWDIVTQVLKDQKMVDAIRYRFIDGLTLEETEKLNILVIWLDSTNARGYNGYIVIVGQDY